LHGDDTTVPVLAKGKTDTRRHDCCAPISRKICGGRWRAAVPLKAIAFEPARDPQTGVDASDDGLSPRDIKRFAMLGSRGR
jgi:hypothetical protein